MHSQVSLRKDGGTPENWEEVGWKVRGGEADVQFKENGNADADSD